MYCVLALDGVENADSNSNNIVFIIKDTKLFVLVILLSAKDLQKLSILLGKRCERSVYWNEYKTKIGNKNTTYEYRYFLQSNFVGVNRLCVLIYPNQDGNAKRYNARGYY